MRHDGLDLAIVIVDFARAIGRAGHKPAEGHFVVVGLVPKEHLVVGGIPDEVESLDVEAIGEFELECKPVRAVHRILGLGTHEQQEWHCGLVGDS